MPHCIQYTNLWIVNWLRSQLELIASRRSFREGRCRNKKQFAWITQIVAVDSMDRISHFQFVLGERSLKWSLCNWAWVMGIMAWPIKRKLIHCHKICRNQRINNVSQGVSDPREVSRETKESFEYINVPHKNKKQIKLQSGCNFNIPHSCERKLYNMEECSCLKGLFYPTSLIKEHAKT